VPEEAAADGRVRAQLLAEAGAKLVRVHYAKPAALGEPLLTIQQAIHAESMYDLSGAAPCVRVACWLEPPWSKQCVRMPNRCTSCCTGVHACKQTASLCLCVCFRAGQSQAT